MQQSLCNFETYQGALDEQSLQNVSRPNLILRKFLNKKGLFIKAFFADGSLNANNWQISDAALHRDLKTGLDTTRFKGRTAPIILRKDFAHPPDELPNAVLLEEQEKDRVGDFIDTGIDPDSGRAFVTGFIFDKRAVEFLEKEAINFVSPSLHGTRVFHSITDGRDIIEAFKVNHLALVKQPAFGTFKAQVRAKCFGTGSECLTQLKNVSASLKISSCEKTGNVIIELPSQDVFRDFAAKLQHGEKITEEEFSKIFQAQQTTDIQTIIFDKEKFDLDKAKKWLKEHDFTSPKVDENEESLRFRQKEPSLFKDKSFRTIELDTGIKAVIGKPKSATKESLKTKSSEGKSMTDNDNLDEEVKNMTDEDKDKLVLEALKAKKAKQAQDEKTEEERKAQEEKDKNKPQEGQTDNDEKQKLEKVAQELKEDVKELKQAVDEEVKKPLAEKIANAKIKLGRIEKASFEATVKELTTKSLTDLKMLSADYSAMTDKLEQMSTTPEIRYPDAYQASTTNDDKDLTKRVMEKITRRSY